MFVLVMSTGSRMSVRLVGSSWLLRVTGMILIFRTNLVHLIRFAGHKLSTLQSHMKGKQNDEKDMVWGKGFVQDRERVKDRKRMKHELKQVQYLSTVKLMCLRHMPGD